MGVVTLARLLDWGPGPCGAGQAQTWGQPLTQDGLDPIMIVCSVHTDIARGNHWGPRPGISLPPARNRQRQRDLPCYSSRPWREGPGSITYTLNTICIVSRDPLHFDVDRVRMSLRPPDKSGRTLRCWQNNLDYCCTGGDQGRSSISIGTI